MNYQFGCLTLTSFKKMSTLNQESNYVKLDFSGHAIKNFPFYLTVINRNLYGSWCKPGILLYYSRTGPRNVEM